MNAVLKAYTLSECMETMAEYAHAYESTGGTNLVFCEDRLTLIAERALVRRTGGTFRSSVSTFSRFLKAEGKALSKQGSVMAVSEVMTRLQREGKLQCFTSSVGVGNNAKSIYETLAQISASEVTPEILRGSLALLPEDMLKRKVSDLAEILENYTAFLEENGLLDESRYLSLLPTQMRRDGVLKGKNVFFLCYDGFTAQATQIIRVALEEADNVIGIFCAGDADVYSNTASEIFAKTCKEYGKVQIQNCGTPLDGIAEILRTGLYRPEQAKKKLKTDAIRVFEAQDKTSEAEFVATKIRREMAENPNLRYRDFSVLVSSVFGYTLPIKKVFGEYGIPCFIDEKRSLKEHPLSRFLLDCFRVVREKYSPISVQALAQNYFFGESDEYRNYLLKFANYRGGAKRPIKTGETVEQLFDVSKAEDGRRRMLLATEGIKSKAKGGEYCKAIRQTLADFDVETKLKNLGERVSDLAQKGYLSQLLCALDGVLSEAELLTKDKELSVGEFEAILKNGLEATEISLIPLRADAVFVGDITDSRIEKVRVLFAMGMTDEVPRNGVDTAIVSDTEIARLAEVKTLLEPTVAEVNLRARENVCLNLCTFSDKLYFSYPLCSDGSDPTTSEIFRYLDGLFYKEGHSGLPRRKGLEKEDFPYACSSVSSAIRQLLTEKREFESGGKDTRKEYASLYSALDKFGVRDGVDYLTEDMGQVCVERGEELFFKDGKISPTALESYFACPFSHFIERGLKLKQREETTVLAMDSGNFVHELLEKTAVKIGEISTESEMREYAQTVGKALLKKSVYAMQQERASGEYFLESLLKEGAEVAVAAYRQVKNSDYVVEETETRVTSDFFQGKVDRVDGTDRFVRVIDYKTGSIDDSATSYYTGQKMQMQLYMSKLKGERIPAGVFYFPASVDYKDGDDGRFRMKGFLNGDQDALRCGDRNIQEREKSEFFPASLVNAPTAKRVMDEETFRKFLDYAVLVARQGVVELKEGFIEPTPYEGKCNYCKYGGACGFKKDVSAVRKEGAIDAPQIARIVAEAQEGKGE